MPSAKKTREEEQLRQDAWVGDAVLELFVRLHILQHHQTLDAEMKQRFTRNEFLACFGVPTEIEARIGVEFRKNGLESSFQFIQDHLLPLFLKQEAKRRRQS